MKTVSIKGGALGVITDGGGNPSEEKGGIIEGMKT